MEMGIWTDLAGASSVATDKLAAWVLVGPLAIRARHYQASLRDKQPVAVWRQTDCRNINHQLLLL